MLHANKLLLGFDLHERKIDETADDHADDEQNNPEYVKSEFGECASDKSQKEQGNQ